LGVVESTDLRFANMTGIGGVGIIGSRYIVFQDNVVQRYNTGVYFGRHENRRGANYSLLRNRFTPIAPWDVYIDGIDGVTIANNEFEQANLDVSGVRSGAIRNNSIRDDTANGLPSVGCGKLSDVTIDRAAVAEVFLSECKRVHIRGMMLDGTEMSILLAACEYALDVGKNLPSIISEAPIHVLGGTNVS